MFFIPSRGRCRRVAWVALAIALAWSDAPGVFASPKDKRACVAARQNARKAELRGSLQRALIFNKRCARATCGEDLRRACVQRATELERDIPTVVFIASNPKGDPDPDVSVAMDGQALLETLDGRARQINPGVHEFSFAKAGEVFSTKEVLVTQGERNRLIAASLPKTKAREQAGPAPVVAPNAPAPGVPTTTKKVEAKATPMEVNADAAQLAEAAPDLRADSGTSWAPYLLSAVGVLGLTGYGVLTYWGRQDNKRLVACSPSCPEASVQHIRNLYAGANISLGVGTLAFIAALFSGDRHDDPGTTNDVAYRINVTPLRAGAFAAVGGVF